MSNQRTDPQDGNTDPVTNLPLISAAQNRRNMARLQQLVTESDAAHVAEVTELRRQLAEARDLLIEADERNGDAVMLWQSGAWSMTGKFGRKVSDYLAAGDKQLPAARPAAERNVTADSEVRSDVTADIEAGREYLQRHPMRELIDGAKAAGEIYNADK